MSANSEEHGIYKRRMERRVTDRTARAIDIAIGVTGLSRRLLFVSGFWRSGTTYLQELLSRSLDAKTVFEPLSPWNSDRDRRLLFLGFSEHNLREAFIPGRAAFDDPMWRQLDRYFRGTLNSRFSTQARSSVYESFRRDVILKDVRLQANLEPLHERYGVPVVHVRRHPCAVVYSLSKARWGWSFENLRLSDIAGSLMKDLNRTGDCKNLLVPEFDADVVSRTAAYWAMTERIVDHSISGKAWAKIVPYGRLVESKGDVVSETGALVGRSPKNPVGDFDSATTITTSMGRGGESRAVSWRKGLEPKEISRIVDIAATVFPKAADGLRARITSSARDSYDYAA